MSDGKLWSKLVAFTKTPFWLITDVFLIIYGFLAIIGLINIPIELVMFSIGSSFPLTSTIWIIDFAIRKRNVR